MNEKISLFLILFLLLFAGCANQGTQSSELLNENANQLQANNSNEIQNQEMPDDGLQNKLISRETAIPSDKVKMLPETDAAPVKSYSDKYFDPVPVEGISTAGAEDSAFIMPEGNELFFFFTPNVDVPAEKQLLDGVTGIYYSKKQGNEWSEAERIMLQDSGKLALDGCEFVQGNKMWFCSAREGYAGINWFTAEKVNGKWANWKNADFNPDYNVGELHISGDGKELFFHSARAGGKGALDLWVSRNENNEWLAPQNISAVNTERDEGWPFVSQDGKELWISRDYGLWRSKKIGGEWTEPELMFSPLAGEASLDLEGNVYFTHHYFKENKMIEADIYVARRK